MPQIDLRPVVQLTLNDLSEPLSYVSLRIEQPLLHHHQCSFIWRLDQQRVMVLSDREDFAQQCLGKELHIRLGEQHLTYFITCVRVVDEQEAASGIFVQAQSPTILIDDIRQNQAYLDADLKTIIQQALSDVPSNLLSTRIEPVCTNSFTYTVQSGETDYAFLQRLSKRYGEFLYYDGKALVMGPPKTGGPTLINGIDLNALRFSTQLHSAHAPYVRYDVMNGQSSQEMVSFPSGVESSDSYLASAAKVSQGLFRHSQHKQSFLFTGEEAPQRDQFKQLKEQAYLSTLVQVQGESIHSGLHPGLVFSVNQGHRSGEYTAIHVTHQSAQNGHYENQFIGIPSSCQVPPYTNPEAYPKGEAQSAIVSNNADPEGLGRIKVNFHWSPKLDSPWLRMVSPHGGAEKGFYFVPEVGEEVQVGFELDNAERPFVLGSLYHGKAKPSAWKNDQNNIKAIRTRSGNEILLNDEDGSIKITDAKGSVFFMDGKGNIALEASKKVRIEAQDIELIARHNLAAIAGNIVSVSARPGDGGGEGQIIVSAENDLNLESQKTNASLTSKDIIEIISKNINIQANQKMYLDGGQLADFIASLIKINS